MSSSLSHAANAEPNLTPLLDMVFQLITFFMLVINFQAAAIDANLRLPVIGSAQPVDTGGIEDLLVLNIDTAGNLTVYGQQRQLQSFIAAEAQATRLYLQAVQSEKLPADGSLPTMVVIRADKATPFKQLNQVIQTCQKHGFLKFSLRTMTKEV